MTRRARLITLCGALALSGIAGFVALTGAFDAIELSRLRSSVSGMPEGRELAAAREALAAIAALDAEPTWRHLWLRTVGQQSRERTVASIAHAVAAAEQLTVDRTAQAEWVAHMRDRVQQAVALSELEELTAAIMRGPPPSSAQLSVATVADLQSLAAQATQRFQEDDAKNAAAIEQARAALDDAGTDVAAIQHVIDMVLPRPDRRPGTRGVALAALRAEAHARRAVELSARVQKREETARAAPSAAQVRVELVALERDPDLRRGVPPSVGLEDARARIEAHAVALDAWEQGRREIEARLAANDPVAAARAMARLRAPDASRSRELNDLRSGFGSRVALTLTKALVHYAEAIDWNGAQSLVASLHSDGAVAALMDEPARIALERSERTLQQVEDRMLYEQFRAAPRQELAERYMEGWPATARQMAPVVASYLEWCRHPQTELLLDAVEWHDIGTPSSPIPDMPDATIELRIDGKPCAFTRIEDISERTRSTLVQPIRIALPEGDRQPIRLAAVVSIDFRDTTLADPIATGSIDIVPAELRAGRTAVVPVIDSTWSVRPHRLYFSAAAVGAPALPPWDAMGTLPAR